LNYGLKRFGLILSPNFGFFKDSQGQLRMSYFPH